MNNFLNEESAERVGEGENDKRGGLGEILRGTRGTILHCILDSSRGTSVLTRF